MVDLVDYQLLLVNFNTIPATFEQGDNNFDGQVDLGDFVQFRTVFNAPALGAAAVPEPTSMCLFAMGVVALLGCVRQCGAHRARR